MTDRDVNALLVAALLHDMGKEREPWQSAVAAGCKPPGHVIPEDILRELPQWSRLGDPQNTKEFEDLVIGACGLHHSAMRTPGAVLAQHLSGGTERRWKVLQELYADIDGIVSCDDPIEAAEQAEARWAGKLNIRWHAVDTVRGVSSALLNSATVEAHVAAGWTPILYFINGTVYTALPRSAERVQPADIEGLLVGKLDHLMPPGFELKLVFGDPTAKFLVRREFVDLSPEKIEAYLFEAFHRMSPKKYERQGASQRAKILKKLDEFGELPDRADERVRTDLLRGLGTAVCLGNVLRWFKELCLEDDCLMAQRYSGDWKRLRADLSNKLPDGWNRLTKLSTLKPAEDLQTIKMALWDNSALNTEGPVRAKAHEEQGKLVISLLMKAYRAAYALLDPRTLPSRLSPQETAEMLVGEVRTPGMSPRHPDFALEAESYSNAKAASAFGERTLMCPLSNEACPPTAGLTRTDLVPGTDKHTNRRRIGSKTWKDMGGFPVAPGTRLELLLRSVLLESDLKDARLLAIVPPKNLSHMAGEELLKQIRLLDAEFHKATDPGAAISEREVAVAFTPSIARNISTLGWGARLPEIVLRTRQPSKSIDKKLGDAILEVLAPQGLEDETGDEELPVQELASRREPEGLRVLAEVYGLQFESWQEAVSAFRDNTRQDVQNLLRQDDALKEVRKTALRMRKPTILAETPNAVLFLLPQRVAKESAVDASIRELFQSIVFARGTGCPCALLTMDEPLTFTGGEGMVRVPGNASLRSHIANWRANQRADGCKNVGPLTHEWLLSSELDVWAEGLLAAHLVTGWADRGLFAGRSPLYDALRVRSAGSLVSRAEQKKVKTQWTSKELELITKLAKLSA